MLHLIAQSHETTLPDAMADALRRIEGAFSFVMATYDHIFAARDPRGFRPLAMGRIPGKDGRRTRLYLPPRPAPLICWAPNMIAT